ncbi:MAG: Glyoxalase/bleomycin resistance protein/dioxygenase [Gemmatimonadetes bacterium]|nr:Glyoxalase/bleomycin resistance protein/dioxygenase [Gemmatimonadota bacterium]
MTPSPSRIPAGFHTATPYLIVENAPAAIEFYRRAFGAEELMRHTDDTGRVRHAEIRIGDSPLMIGQPFEWEGVRARTPREAAAITMALYLYVDDPDALHARAVSAGAAVQTPMSDTWYGERMGGVTDPFGHVWWIAARIEELSDDEARERMAANPRAS